jgi:DNA end-binding protein Ku
VCRAEGRPVPDDEIVKGPRPPPPPPDLMAALQASLERTRGRNGQSARPDRAGLERLTRDELYERAREEDVPGRADMSKTELVTALSSDRS